MQKRVSIIPKIIQILCLLVFSLPAIAADIRLAWDPSLSPGISGYRVYVGQSSRSYGTPITIGNQTTYTVTNLANGTWFIAVTAFDASGNESGFSNEVSATISPTPLDPPTLAEITSISVPSITTQYATVAWATSLDCSGTVYYGTLEPLTRSVKANNLGSTEHLAVIGPLITRTHYLFKVESICNGTTINSGIRSFNTK